MKASEIVVQFSRPPAILFGEGKRFNVAPNLLVIRIQPNEGVTLYLNSKTRAWKPSFSPSSLLDMKQLLARIPPKRTSD